MTPSTHRLPGILAKIVALGLAQLACLSTSSAADGDVLFSAPFTNQSDIAKLSLDKGVNQVVIGTYNIGGRNSSMLKCTQKESGGWESIIGNPDIATVRHATIRYRVYFPRDSWQFRLQGKLPGLTPTTPHFGGNVNDPVVWNKWSVRLMWLSTTNTIENGDDTKARPSIYVYNQNRQTGSFGQQNVVSGYYFPENSWQNISIYVRCNTHSGSTARSDGLIKLYINGALLSTVSGQKLIGNIPSGQSASAAWISGMAFHNYYGGSKTDSRNVPTTGTTSCFFDDLSVVEGDRPL